MKKINKQKNFKLRARIISRAREVFTRWGIKKTTMNDIAEGLHMAKSSLYHYYTSKEKIFQEVLEKDVLLFKKEMRRVINKENTPQAQLRTYVITRMYMLKKLAALYSTFKEEYLESFGFIESIRQKYDRMEIKTIQGILRTGIRKGLFIIKNLPLTAAAIVTGLKAFEYPWAVEKNIRKIETAIDHLLEIFLYGLIKR